MNKQQIKKAVNKRLMKPALALAVFHMIGSMSLHYFNSTGELSLHLILAFVVMNVFFLFALMVDLLVNVLSDLSEEDNGANSNENT